MFRRFKNLQLERPLIVLDLEATGTDPKNDRIVEFAVLHITPEEEPWVVSGQLNPGIPIPPAATAIHGISDADVAKCPRFDSIADVFQDYLGNGNLCGYDIKKFGLPLLNAEFARCGMGFSVADRRIIDACQIFRGQEERDLAGAVRFFCGREFPEAHTTHEDVDAIALVLDAQLARYSELPRTVEELHWHFAGPDVAGNFRREEDCLVFNFGKHAGRRLRDVAAEDPRYIEWLAAEGSFLEDTRAIARQVTRDPRM